MLELCCEVPQKVWRFHYLHAAHIFASLPNQVDCFQHVVHVALCIDATWNGQSYQIKVSGFFLTAVRVKTEHYGADFDGTNSSFNIELDC